MLLTLAIGVACAGSATSQTSPFSQLIDRLSEPGGYFDTDNLISNERSFLHAIGPLRAHGVAGGAYLGVGPDQNFSYIAEIQPELALIVDIRRDNLLEHLLFKALFTEAQSRVEYLGLLVGRSPPPLEAGASVDALVTAIDRAGPDAAAAGRARDVVRVRVSEFGMPLSAEDLATIERFHNAFIDDGLDLRFNSFGRAPQPYYPTYRDLLLETDLSGRQVSFLSSDEGFQRLRRMQLENRIVPVVGNLAGQQALPAIAAYLNERNLPVTAFYTSNVEFYLFGAGTFAEFVRNVRALPTADNAVIIRSVFRGGRGGWHPDQVAGYASTQLVQPISSLLTDPFGLRGYWDLVTRDVIREP